MLGEMTQPENGTGKRTEIVVIVHAEGVLGFLGG